jgi:uncharacterized membrane protein
VTGLLIAGGFVLGLTVLALVQRSWPLLIFCGIAWVAVLGQLTIEREQRRRDRRRNHDPEGGEA